MNTVEQKSPVLRRIPPAAGFPSPAAIFSAWRKFLQTPDADLQIENWFRHLLIEALAVRDVLLTSSGTTALRRVFAAGSEILGRKEVLLSAYTCPDIASAALAAGCRVRLLDVECASLQLQGVEEALSRDTLGVVLSNLYGLPDNLESIRVRCRSEKILLIDDACQAALSRRGESAVGCGDDSFGILSFGRGKAFGALGGGALILPKVVAEWQREVFARAATVEQVAPAALHSLKHGIMAPLVWVLQHPWFYSLPDSLAFLHLGETRVHSPTPDLPMSAVQLLAAAAQLEQREHCRQQLQRVSERWRVVLQGMPLEQPMNVQSANETVAIRFPILLPQTRTREQVYQVLRQAGLGASCSYQRTLDSFAELRDQLQFGEHPGARAVGERLLTLPVHRWVKPEDQERTAMLIKRHLP